MDDTVLPCLYRFVAFGSFKSGEQLSPTSENPFKPAQASAHVRVTSSPLTQSKIREKVEVIDLDCSSEDLPTDEEVLNISLLK